MTNSKILKFLYLENFHQPSYIASTFVHRIFGIFFFDFQMQTQAPSSTFWCSLMFSGENRWLIYHFCTGRPTPNFFLEHAYLLLFSWCSCIILWRFSIWYSFNISLMFSVVIWLSSMISDINVTLSGDFSLPNLKVLQKEISKCNRWRVRRAYISNY